MRPTQQAQTGTEKAVADNSVYSRQLSQPGSSLLAPHLLLLLSFPASEFLLPWPWLRLPLPAHPGQSGPLGSGKGLQTAGQRWLPASTLTVPGTSRPGSGRAGSRRRPSANLASQVLRGDKGPDFKAAWTTHRPTALLLTAWREGCGRGCHRPAWVLAILPSCLEKHLPGWVPAPARKPQCSLLTEHQLWPPSASIGLPREPGL